MGTIAWFVLQWSFLWGSWSVLCLPVTVLVEPALVQRLSPCFQTLPSTAGGFSWVNVSENTLCIYWILLALVCENSFFTFDMKEGFAGTPPISNSFLMTFLKNLLFQLLHQNPSNWACKHPFLLPTLHWSPGECEEMKSTCGRGSILECDQNVQLRAACLDLVWRDQDTLSGDGCTRLRLTSVHDCCRTHTMSARNLEYLGGSTKVETAELYAE